MLIECYDPGETTGYAKIYFDEHSFAILDYRAIHEGPWGLFPQVDSDVMVVEGFYPEDTFVNTTPLEVIGILKQHSIYAGAPIVMQKRTDKSRVSDQKMKDAGLWIENYEVNHVDARDVNDAIKHGIIYAMNNGCRHIVERLFPDV